MTLVAEKVSAQGDWVVRSQSSSTGRFMTIADKGGKIASPVKSRAAAVHSYLRAVRAVGRRSVSAADVASALGLSEREARKILTTMTDKGVKPR